MSRPRIRASLAVAFVMLTLAACSPGVPPSSTPRRDIFDRVIVIGRHVQPIPAAEVEALETELGFGLPSGYRELMARFGEGEYADLFRWYAPDRLRELLPEARQRWADFWFFAGSEDQLTQRDLATAALVGDTIDGDELVAHPKRRDVVYVLPRDSDRIVTVPADLRTVHEWAKREEPVTFQPFAHQAALESSFQRFALEPAELLERVRARWGQGASDVVVTHEGADAWAWSLVLFVPSAGLRIQVVEDSGQTRSFVDGRGVKTTIQGSGRPFLGFQIHGDEEAVPEGQALLDELVAEGRLTPG